MNKLQEMRNKSKLSQSQLSKRAGISIRTLQNYEIKRNKFDHARFDTILKVALNLNCKIEDLIEDEEFLELWETYLNKNVPEN